MAVALAGSAFSSGWQHTTFLILLGLLCVGLFTPVICGLAAAAVLLNLVYRADAHTAKTVVVALATLSLGILGPGAFSADARLFGRRIVISTSKSNLSEGGQR